MEKNLKNATSETLNKSVSLESLMRTCRICLGPCRLNGDFKCIFTIKEPDKDSVIEKIKFCTGVQLQQFIGLKSAICALCRYNLSVAYDFKMNCLKANKSFQKLVEELPEAKPNTDEDILNVKQELQTIDVKQENDDHLSDDDDKVGLFDDDVQNDEIDEKPEKLVSPPRRGRGRPRKTETKPKTKKYNKKQRKYKFRKLWCESCNLKFDTKEQSDAHKKEIHKDSDNWVCEVCGKIFIHRASHYSHVKSHQPPNYACDQCDYKTWHRHDLVKHIRIHTGIKLYQCEYCTASYYNSSNLTSHIRRHHMLERPHSCHICRRSFFDKTKLNRHLDSHLDIKRFECQVCHACFTRRCYWKKHLLRQHDIITPPQRPGRQKINMVIGDCLVNKQEVLGDLFNKETEQKV